MDERIPDKCSHSHTVVAVGNREAVSMCLCSGTLARMALTRPEPDFDRLCYERRIAGHGLTSDEMEACLNWFFSRLWSGRSIH
jgi:hypothetical protein